MTGNAFPYWLSWEYEVSLIHKCSRKYWKECIRNLYFILGLVLELHSSSNTMFNCNTLVPLTSLNNWILWALTVLFTSPLITDMIPLRECIWQNRGYGTSYEIHFNNKKRKYYAQLSSRQRYDRIQKKWNSSNKYRNGSYWRYKITVIDRNGCNDHD